MFKYKFLGSGGVCPLPNRGLTALYVQNQSTSFLIDCGENTQAAAKQNNVSLFNINAILLTHLHTDHVLGLPGLLSTLTQMGRTEPLIVYGPSGTVTLVSTCLKLIATTSFPILPMELAPKDKIEFKDINVSLILLKHSITCYGYSIEVIRRPSYKEDVVKQLQLSPFEVAALQDGYTIKHDDVTMDIHTVFGKDREKFKLVYATDTGYCQELVDGCQNADIAILDGSYGDKSLIPDCNKEFPKEDKPPFNIVNALKHRENTPDPETAVVSGLHMTFEEAATVAAKANVKSLILTHFIPTTASPEDYLPNATRIFKNTMCAYAGLGTDELYNSTRMSNDAQKISVSKPTLSSILRESNGFVLTKQLSRFSRDECLLVSEGLPMAKVRIVRTCYLVNNSICNEKYAKENRESANALLYVQLLRLYGKVKGASNSEKTNKSNR